MLTNFMDLVSAVKLASMRTMTKNRASDYTFYMHRYLTKLLDLYPGAEISPNQHMSMHLEQVLLDFGPSHSFRSFGFERSNYLLQQIPTNNKVGQLVLIHADIFEIDSFPRRSGSHSAESILHETKSSSFVHDSKRTSPSRTDDVRVREVVSHRRERYTSERYIRRFAWTGGISSFTTCSQ